MEKKGKREKQDKLTTMKFKEPKLKSTKAYAKRRKWKNLKEWFSDYYRVAIPAFICIVLVIVVIAVMLSQKGNNDAAPQEETPAAEVPVEELTIPEEPLEENAYEIVNQFINVYYASLANGDTELIKTMRDATDDNEVVHIQKRSNYIESYQNIACYTKKGLAENSFIVYVYYEVKFYDIDTLAPGLNTLYVCTNENGELYVSDPGETGEAADYIQIVSTQDDVADLFNRVQVKYAEVVDTDEVLKAFLDEISTKLKADVAEGLAALEAEQNPVEPEVPTEEETPDATDGEETVEPEAPTTDMVKTIERVNIRASASAESTKLGTAARGDVFTRTEILENGWSKIDYNGSEAYIMTEYLETVQDVIGSVTVLENVNVRASASASATKLGFAYAGEVYELVEVIENGWSEINFNGQTAYIKSEYLKQN